MHQPGPAIDITVPIEGRQAIGRLISEYRRAAEQSQNPSSAAVSEFWNGKGTSTAPGCQVPGEAPAPVMPGSGMNATLAYPATLGLYRALTGFRRTLGKVILSRVATATIRTLPERLATALTK